uniref:Uncharacterized protein n=1 Tax=Photinus pyralis TaxID=7054 RepID=A0A1Y1MP82_PHOPY
MQSENKKNMYQQIHRTEVLKWNVQINLLINLALLFPSYNRNVYICCVNCMDNISTCRTEQMEIFVSTYTMSEQLVRTIRIRHLQLPKLKLQRKASTCVL